MDWTELSWPIAQAPLALAELARHCGLHPQPGSGRSPEFTSRDFRATDRSMESAAVAIGLQADAVSLRYSEVNDFLRTIKAALLWIDTETGCRILPVVGAGWNSALVLTPSLSLRRIPLSLLRDAVSGPLEKEALPEIDKAVPQLEMPQGRRAGIRAALLEARLGKRAIHAGWSLSLSPSRNMLFQFYRSGLFPYLIIFIAGYALQYAFWVLAWKTVGQNVLSNGEGGAWQATFAFFLLGMVVLRGAAGWAQGWLAIRAGGLLKRRLLFGALRLDPESIRSEGSGELLGRVMESEAVETLAIGGGMISLSAVIELIIAGWVAAQGERGLFLVAALLAWFTAALLMGAEYYRRRKKWTGSRLSLTGDLMEKMAGHRTRLAQQSPSQWHAGEGEAVAQSVSLAAPMDRLLAGINVFLSHGWLIAGFLILAPAFIAGSGPPDALAIGLGSVILIYQAFKKFGEGMCNLIGMAVAWDRVAPMYRAAGLPSAPSISAPSGDAPSASLLEARRLSFRYPRQDREVLAGCNLRIAARDRILLAGRSGSGKSTLAMLLAGLQEPVSGTILLDGSERRVAGDDVWRAKVVVAPQFHENHILTEPFAFNALLGRCWPPEPADLAEAEELCRTLGLGPLLDRMPSGIMQVVGEGGWQLSHGERSRLYLARAILQHPDVMILDESFGALDPELLAASLRCAMERANALVVIAHP